MAREYSNPAEKIAELQAALLRAQAALALAGQSENPMFRALSQRQDELQGQINSRARFWSGNQSQTFEGRLRTHRAWLAEIECQEAYESAAHAADKAEREALKALKVQVAAILATGTPDCAETAAVALRDGMAAITAARPDLSALERNLDLATRARKAWTAQKSAPTGRPRGRPRKVQDEEEAEAGE